MLRLSKKETPVIDKKVKVAVYGNEKIGMCRHNLLGKNRKLIGAGWTKKKFSMGGHDMAMVFDNAIAKVKVEVWEIDEKQLRALDQYHGCWSSTTTSPSKRSKVDVIIDYNDTVVYDCVFYVYNFGLQGELKEPNRPKGYDWTGARCLTLNYTSKAKAILEELHTETIAA